MSHVLRIGVSSGTVILPTVGTAWMPESVYADCFTKNKKAQGGGTVARSEGESAIEKWRCAGDGTEMLSAVAQVLKIVVAELIQLTDHFRNVTPHFVRGKMDVGHRDRCRLVKNSISSFSSYPYFLYLSPSLIQRFIG